MVKKQYFPFSILNAKKKKPNLTIEKYKLVTSTSPLSKQYGYIIIRVGMLMVTINNCQFQLQQVKS